MSGKFTIRDVARLAGVSTATVSRVLNDKPDVDQATRERVRRIVDEQRFVPSIAGTGLAGGRTGLVGVLMPSLTWAIMSPILGGVADVIEQTAHELVLYGHSHKQERGEIIQRIVDARLIDGLIAVYPDGAAFASDVCSVDDRVSHRLSELHRRGFPVVVIDDQRAHDDIPWISADSRDGAVQAVRYLHSLGHKRIAHITGPLDYLCSQERLAGYRAAAAEAQLPLDPNLVIQGDFTVPSGHAAMNRLLSLAEPPTAVFAANDDMAYGVLNAVRHRGLTVPGDVAVIGFDDAEPSASTAPPLTTMRQPFFDMGRRAAALLAALLTDPRTRPEGGMRSHLTNVTSALVGAASAPVPALRIDLPVALVERASTKTPQLVHADR
jgi:LacI family transcriptional regulator